MKTGHFFLVWLAGFALLFGFDVFMELVVFERLGWNGTTKNDWFFVLWWALVFGWFLYGVLCFIRRSRSRTGASNSA